MLRSDLDVLGKISATDGVGSQGKFFQIVGNCLDMAQQTVARSSRQLTPGMQVAGSNAFDHLYRHGRFTTNLSKNGQARQVAQGPYERQ